MNVIAQAEKHTQWAPHAAQSIEFAKHSCETNNIHPLNSKRACGRCINPLEARTPTGIHEWGGYISGAVRACRKVQKRSISDERNRRVQSTHNLAIRGGQCDTQAWKARSSRCTSARRDARHSLNCLTMFGRTAGTPLPERREESSPQPPCIPLFTATVWAKCRRSITHKKSTIHGRMGQRDPQQCKNTRRQMWRRKGRGTELEGAMKHRSNYQEGRNAHIQKPPCGGNPAWQH